MSSLEMSIAPGVSIRRAGIAEIDAQLRELNEIFPGERKKDPDDQNPVFRDARRAMLGRRQLLSGAQHPARRILRGIHR